MTVIPYKGALICPRKGSVDVIFGKRWFNRPTTRSAKWWVSVYNRFTDDVGT